MSKRALVLCQRKAGLNSFKPEDVKNITKLIETLLLEKRADINIEYMTLGLCDDSNRAEDMDYKIEFGKLSDDFIEFLLENEKQYDAIVLGFCPVANGYFKTPQFIADLHILLKDKKSFIAYYPNMKNIISEDARHVRNLFNQFLDGYFKVFVRGVWKNECKLSAIKIRKYKRQLIKKEKEKEIIDLTMEPQFKKQNQEEIIDLTMEPQFKKTKSRRKTARKSARKSLRKSLRKSKKRGSNLKRNIKI